MQSFDTPSSTTSLWFCEVHAAPLDLPLQHCILLKPSSNTSGHASLHEGVNLSWVKPATTQALNLFLGNIMSWRRCFQSRPSFSHPPLSPGGGAPRRNSLITLRKSPVLTRFTHSCFSLGRPTLSAAPLYHCEDEEIHFFCQRCSQVSWSPSAVEFTNVGRRRVGRPAADSQRLSLGFFWLHGNSAQCVSACPRRSTPLQSSPTLRLCNICADIRVTFLDQELLAVSPQDKGAVLNPLCCHWLRERNNTDTHTTRVQSRQPNSL